MVHTYVFRPVFRLLCKYYSDSVFLPYLLLISSATILHYIPGVILSLLYCKQCISLILHAVKIPSSVIFRYFFLGPQMLQPLAVSYVNSESLHTEIIMTGFPGLICQSTHCKHMGHDTWYLLKDHTNVISGCVNNRK